MTMQAALNPALAAAMTLERAAQVGEFQPMTRDGQPTVAAQLMQKAMPPSIPQIAQQAGLAGQIQAMQMQQAQQNLMQQAMAQRPPAGIEGLNPQVGGFAEGGIVGYQSGGMTLTQPSVLSEAPPLFSEQMGPAGGLTEERRQQYEDALALQRAEQALRTYGARQAAADPEGFKQAKAARDEAAQKVATHRRLISPEESESRFRDVRAVTPEELEMYRKNLPTGIPQSPMMAIPEISGFLGDKPKADQKPPAAAPAMATAPAAVKVPSVEGLFERARSEYGGMQTGAASAADIAARLARDDPAYRQYLISQGHDPDVFAKRMEEDKALFQAQRDLMSQKMAREQGKDTFLSRLGEAARGFRQLKGQGIGAGLLSSEAALSRRVEASEALMDQMREAQLKINELEITRRRALQDQKRAIDEGKWDKAAAAITTERNAANEIKKLQAGTYAPQAQAVLEAQKIASMEKSRLSGEQAQEFARLQGLASAHEGRKVAELRKLDEDFAKQHASLLNIENMLGADKLSPEQRKQLENARRTLRENKADIAKQFDERINMLNAKMYPGVDFSTKPTGGSSSIEAARKIVGG